MKQTITTVLALAATLTATKGFIVNGSFEDTSATYVNSAPGDYMNGSTTVTAPGWYLALNSPDWFWGEGPAGRWETPYGDHFGSAAANGFDGAAYREVLGQVVTGLTIGQEYTLSFDHANGLFYNTSSSMYEGVGTVGGWQVLIDTVSVLLTNSTNDNTSTALDHTSSWQNSSVNFTATDTSHDFWFAAWRPGDGSQSQVVTFQWIDHVSINPVPEPGITLLGSLGVLLGMMHRRRDAECMKRWTNAPWFQAVQF